jgi:hypothetical protein
MDRYLVIDITSDGLAFETAQLDFYLSPLGMALVIVSVVAYKIYKTKKTKRVGF